MTLPNMVVLKEWFTQRYLSISQFLAANSSLGVPDLSSSIHEPDYVGSKDVARQVFWMHAWIAKNLLFLDDYLNMCSSFWLVCWRETVEGFHIHMKLFNEPAMLTFWKFA